MFFRFLYFLMFLVLILVYPKENEDFFIFRVVGDGYYEYKDIEELFEGEDFSYEDVENILRRLWKSKLPEVIHEVNKISDLFRKAITSGKIQEYKKLEPYLCGDKYPFGFHISYSKKVPFIRDEVIEDEKTQYLNDSINVNNLEELAAAFNGLHKEYNKLNVTPDSFKFRLDMRHRTFSQDYKIDGWVRLQMNFADVQLNCSCEIPRRFMDDGFRMIGFKLPNDLVFCENQQIRCKIFNVMMRYDSNYLLPAFFKVKHNLRK